MRRTTVQYIFFLLLVLLVTQALQAAAAVQEGATVSSWVTFGMLVLTLVVAILGAMAGIPSLRTWRV